MNTINSPIQECDRKLKQQTVISFAFKDVRLDNHLTENQNLQSSLSLFYQNIRGSQFGLENILKPWAIKINLGIYNFIVIC